MVRGPFSCVSNGADLVAINLPVALCYSSIGGLHGAILLAVLAVTC